MKRKIYTSYAALLFWAMVFCFCTANAADLSFQPRLEAGVMYYSFESEAVSITQASDPVAFNAPGNFTQQAFKYGDNLPFIGVGGTFYLNRFFLDLSGQYAFDGKDRETISYSSFGYSYNDELTYFGHYVAQPTHNASFERRDMAVSLGYAFTRQFSLFVGYKKAKTEFTTLFEGPMNAVYDDVDPDRDFSSGILIWGEDDYSFEYEGPFVGAIYGWDFSQGRIIKGMLTANLALAHLEGEVVLNQQRGYMRLIWLDDQQFSESITLSLENGGMANRYDSKGSTLGFTIGVGWRGLTALEGLSYFIGISGYRYEFDADNDEQSDINETAVVYKGGLCYTF